MKTHKDIAIFLLRIALTATFLSAVASRLGLWGAQSSGWQNFLAYAAGVISYAPVEVIPVLAITSTVLETAFAILLITGYKIRLASYGASILTLIFALSMAWSFGLKSPLDYSVFVDCAGAFMLGSIPESYRWSLDEFLINESTIKRYLSPQKHKITKV